jgi:uncharacterized protein YdaU (DUF1376 family)
MVRRMSLPYYKRFPRDFLEGTIGLSFEVKGAYAIVLDLIYMRDGRLPDDARYIAGQLGCSVRKWTAILSDLVTAGKLHVTDGIITNFRADYLTEESRKYQDKQAQIAGNPRKNKPLCQPQASQSEPEPEKIDNPTGYSRPKADALPVQEAFDEWNATANRRRLPVAKSLTASRRKQIKARLAEGGMAGWREALSAVESSPLCLGDNERGWRADLDFICQPKSFAKLREGSYAPAGKPGQSPPRALAEMSPELIARRRALLEQAPETPNA